MIWYIREGRDGELRLMINYYQAELLARDLSRTNASGIIETVVQETETSPLFVDGIFLRGRKLQRGQRARESSRLGLPPKI